MNELSPKRLKVTFTFFFAVEIRNPEELEKKVSLKRFATALETYFNIATPGGCWYSIEQQAQGLRFAEELKKVSRSEDLEGFVNQFTPLQYSGQEPLLSIVSPTPLAYLNSELREVLGDLGNFRKGRPLIFIYWNQESKKLEYEFKVGELSG